MIYGLDENDWATYMIYFLKNNVLSSELFCTNIYENKNLFIINDNEYLLYKINDNISPYVSYAFRADFIEQMHSEYSHLKYSELLKVVNSYNWWYILKKNLRDYIKMYLQC